MCGKVDQMRVVKELDKTLCRGKRNVRRRACALGPAVPATGLLSRVPHRPAVEIPGIDRLIADDPDVPVPAVLKDIRLNELHRFRRPLYVLGEGAALPMQRPADAQRPVKSSRHGVNGPISILRHHCLAVVEKSGIHGVPLQDEFSRNYKRLLAKCPGPKSATQGCIARSAMPLALRGKNQGHVRNLTHPCDSVNIKTCSYRATNAAESLRAQSVAPAGRRGLAARTG